MSYCRPNGYSVAGAGSSGSDSKMASILGILRNISLGQMITVGTEGGPPPLTGRFAGIENGNVLLTSATGALQFIPLRQIAFVTIP
ncbi:hypothetical protein J2T14_004504 [Paenibacillus harenae]|nr:hypothetical protein [Paenibacillus harenae]